MSKLNMAELIAKARAASAAKLGAHQALEQTQAPTTTQEDRVVAKLIGQKLSTYPGPATVSAIELLRTKLREAAKNVSNQNTKQEQTLQVKKETEEEKSTSLSESTPLEGPLEGEVIAASTATGMHGEAITYNAEQQQIIDLASSGQSCVLLGAAGTGKTTSTQGSISALITNGSLPILQGDGHRYLRGGSPGVIIIAYTRRAVNNSRKVQSLDLKDNCITVHKLLEYTPVKYEMEDPATGEIRKTMRFEPQRHTGNPLPTSIHTIIVEESSMLSYDLFMEVQQACLHKVQWVFVGDIQQLPPVFGKAILGYKMLELPVVELTQVYRQALESPIIRLAHRILSGVPIPVEEYPEWDVPGKLTLRPIKKKLGNHHMVQVLFDSERQSFFKTALDNGSYDPELDTILMPHGKPGTVGTVDANAHIANYLARKRQAITYEIISGFNKFYFSSGDKVLYDKEDAVILSIESNPNYVGKRTKAPSMYLDYWGHNVAPKELKGNGAYELASDPNLDFDADALLDSIVAGSGEDRSTQASHKIVLRLLDSDREIEICKSSDVNTLIHAYALTIHKSQGSEWRRVYAIFHHSHSNMMYRELLYTAVTRAREELYVICEPDTFVKGILAQRIKGNTLQEKAEFFKGKLEQER